MNKRSKFGFFLLGVAIAFVAAVLGGDPDHAETQQQEYCRMVELHRSSTDPDIGWPDFNNSYNRECTHANGTR